MPTTKEFFAKRLSIELPAFGKVIRALPETQLAYRPHERNTPAGALAWQMAQEIVAIAGMMDAGDVRMDAAPQPASVEEIASAFENAARSIIERIPTVTDDFWTGPARFYFGGQLAMESKVEDMAWGFLFDLVHHRGQLSAYLRPMGGKVPAIYGPSGDEQ
jgi:uncharacterized damage-inducible protein DinB